MKLLSIPVLVLTIFPLLTYGSATACQPAPAKNLKSKCELPSACRPIVRGTLLKKCKLPFAVSNYATSQENRDNIPPVPPNWTEIVTPGRIVQKQPGGSKQEPHKLWHAPTKEDVRIKEEIEKAQIDFGVNSPEACRLIFSYSKIYHQRKEFQKAKELLDQLVTIDKAFNGVEGLSLNDITKPRAETIQSLPGKNPDVATVKPAIVLKPGVTYPLPSNLNVPSYPVKLPVISCTRGQSSGNIRVWNQSGNLFQKPSPAQGGLQVPPGGFKVSVNHYPNRYNTNGFTSPKRPSLSDLSNKFEQKN